MTKRGVDLREAEPAPAAIEGDMEPWCFRRLWLDSLPLVSDRLGEPGRLRVEADGLVRKGCFSVRPEGVLALVEDPEISLLSPLAFCSSSFLLSSSRR